MALKSNFLPAVALWVTLAFSWCYALAGPAFPTTGAGAEHVGAPAADGLAQVESGARLSFCDSCFSLAATTAKTERPSAAPPADAAAPPMAKAPPSAPAGLHTNYNTPSGGLALHRTSLLRQATLIRI